MRRIVKATFVTLFAGLFAVLPVRGTWAEGSYPSHSIRMIVPFAAGNVTDSIARLISDRLGHQLKQSIVVENRPGASGIIGMTAIKQSHPDGYTLGFSAIGPLALNPALYSKLPYSSEADFSVISVVYLGPMLLLVAKDSPLKRPQDVVKLSLSNNEGVNYTTPGKGSSQHLTARLFQKATNARLNHVPSQGSGQAASLLLGKHVPILFDSVTAAMPFLQSGQMRALAVSSDKRLPILPNIPTFRELGYPGVVIYGWLSVIAPKGVSVEKRQFLAKKIEAVMATPEMQKAIANLGGIAEPMTMNQSIDYVKQEIKGRGDLIRSIGLKFN